MSKTDMIVYSGVLFTVIVVILLMLISLIKARYKNIMEVKNKAKYIIDRTADIYKTLSSVDYDG